MLIVKWLTILTILKGENMDNSKFSDRQVIRRLICVNRMHMTVTENSVRQLGVHRSQHHMLMAIGAKSGISQKDIATHMEISPAAVAVALKKLESAGLVERQASEDDSRINNIRLTQLGEDITKQSRDAFDAIDASILKDFSDEDKETLCTLLDRMKQNLKELSPSCEFEDLRKD